MESWKTIKIGDSLRFEYLRLWEWYPDRMKEWRDEYDLPPRPGGRLNKFPIEKVNLNGITKARDVCVPLKPLEVAVIIRLDGDLGPQWEDIRWVARGIQKSMELDITGRNKPRKKKTTQLRIQVVHAFAQGADPLDYVCLYPRVSAKSRKGHVEAEFDEAMEIFKECRPWLALFPPVPSTFFS